MDEMRLIGEQVENFYETLHLRARHYAEALDKESSTLVDQDGELVNLFEWEKPHSPDYMDLATFMEEHENLGPIPAEIGIHGGMPIPPARPQRAGKKETLHKPAGSNGALATPSKQQQQQRRDNAGDSGSDDDDSSASDSSDRFRCLSALSLFS